MDWLKAIIEKTKLQYILISVLVTAIYFKFINTDTVVLIIVFCATYLIVNSIHHLSNRWSENSRKAAVERENMQYNMSKYEQHKEDVWHMFLSLNDRDLQLLTSLYRNESADPTNKYVRIIPNLKYHTYSMLEEKLHIPKGDRSYYPCIFSQRYGESYVMRFEGNFYELVKHYCETGRKDKQ
ncbi:hypothetical protein M2451_000560 [Dysgonomonas sp. PFB1-18]|uniref:hypothetical protein n=1 Tax=unclassified Dysgonomonas TaxID=2630389 RepID=UPI0024752FA0|nr:MULTISPECIES: hypothetical protein [unclassified Dysgonomonas]MDH6307411.1 hypothetical protein [Dysgonomonas sp. PF1-14]MDH6337329.1 hypothetical protein [Dysgonomonas sp. PF1-16]MDH6379253.1 hypothetical protein [Dysgonomonas sp. PFB1-18]MDH6396109.1 hypothetical protein [Dysgonomonas sp. PF1-23]